jgi:hypothetical protein
MAESKLLSLIPVAAARQTAVFHAVGSAQQAVVMARFDIEFIHESLTLVNFL